MRIFLRKPYLRQLRAFLREDGQDLVEYALVIALIAFGLVAGLHSFAGALNTALTHMGTTLAGSI